MIEECVCRVQQQQIVKHLHTVRTYRYCSYPGVVCEESSKPTQGALCATNCAGAEFRGRFGQQQCSDEKWPIFSWCMTRACCHLFFLVHESSDKVTQFNFLMRKIPVLRIGCLYQYSHK